ncbi:hypothetical protein [Stenotrophomonas maltophilia]|uniref:hypothetical protein n=1 Tax=Stenotrophomonas maltophilia TaxID=40324 RepID=UPI0039F74168
MPQKLIDQATIQPDGRPGDDAFTAFATCNDNFEDAEHRLTTLEGGSSNIGQDLADLKVGLQQEAQLRADADAAEATARQNADTALGARFIGKNRFINGDFRFWQRGTNFPAATGTRYTADRWNSNGTGSSIWVQRVDVPAGGGTVPLLKNAKYMLQAVVGSVAGAGNFALIQQRVEGVRELSDKTVTVSFKAKASVANFKVGVEAQQSFGAGGSAGVDSIVSSVTLGTDWQQFSVQLTIPSVVGKTITTGDYLQISFWLDAGANFAGRSGNAGQKNGTVSIAEVQVEEGTAPTPFEYRPDALELALCQRYYEKSYDVETQPGASAREGCVRTGLTGGFFMAMGSVSFKVSKRSAPAVTTYAARNGAVGQLSEVNSSGSYVANRSCNPSFIGQQNFNVGGDAYTAGNNGEYHWTADAEI